MKDYHGRRTEKRISYFFKLFFDELEECTFENIIEIHSIQIEWRYLPVSVNEIQFMKRGDVLTVKCQTRFLLTRNIIEWMRLMSRSTKQMAVRIKTSCELKFRQNFDKIT